MGRAAKRFESRGTAKHGLAGDGDAGRTKRGGVCAGAVGGSVFHFIKGLRNYPKGRRLAGAFTQVRLRAPALGGA